MYKYILTIIVFLNSANSLFCQNNNFELNIGIGGIFSQIEGDSLLGYHHLGAAINSEVILPISSKWDVGIHIGLSQQGSSDRFQFSGSKNNGNNRFIDLNYADVASFIYYNEWVEQDIKKLMFILGIEYNRLLSGRKYENFLGTELSEFNKSTISALGGIQFSFSRLLNFRLSYQRSINYLYKKDSLRLKPFSIQGTFQFRII